MAETIAENMAEHYEQKKNSSFIQQYQTGDGRKLFCHRNWKANFLSVVKRNLFCDCQTSAILRPQLKQEIAMKTSTYPTIGQKLSFIRQNLNDKENPIHQGVGIVCALSMDAHMRLVATMLTLKNNGSGESEKVNVDLQCLSPSDEFVETFKGVTQAVQSLQSEGNGKAAAVVAEYNQQIQSAYSGVLGAPLEVEAL